MKKLLIVILSIIDFICVAAFYYLLFTSESVSSAVASVILPIIIAMGAAFLIGKLSSPAELPSSAEEHTEETLRRSA